MRIVVGAQGNRRDWDFSLSMCTCNMFTIDTLAQQSHVVGASDIIMSLLIFICPRNDATAL